MIPLVLVTGFLGSGKTTLLQRIARSRQGRDAVFLVNEFGELNIDATRVSGLGAEVFEVTGGSLFCECKVGDFLASLTRIKARFDQMDRPLRGAIIETSGIADPTVLTKLLRDTGNADCFRVARALALVSPIRFSQYERAYPNLAAQIQTSDHVILNKIDLASEAELAAVEARIRELNPVATIQRARFAQADIDLWDAPQPQREEKGALAVCPNPYATVSSKLSPRVSIESIRSLCERNANTILRAKGAVRGPEGPIRFDFASDRFSTEPEPNPQADSHLAIIVDESRESWAMKLKAEIDSCFSERPPS